METGFQLGGALIFKDVKNSIKKEIVIQYLVQKV